MLWDFFIFKVDNIKNEAILRDFLNVWTWQRQKRSNSARLLHFSNLTTSKTKQFCETSFKNGKLTAELTASCQCLLRFFQSICLKLLHLPRKSDARSYEVLHLSRKTSQQTWRSEAPKCSPSQEMRARTSSQILWTCLLYCACRGKGIFADPLQMSHACNGFWKCSKTLTFCSLLTRRTIPCACHAKRHLNVQTCPNPSC